jgi:hypothetical protein
MNRFEKRPFTTICCGTIICLLFAVLLSEIGLRIANPPTVSFVYQYRQILRFHPSWRVDYEPNTATWFRLSGSPGTYLFNFLVTINAHGFRTWDRELDNNVMKITKGTKIIHATGDSFTMGWGVNYEASYPAILDSMLSPNTRVINLGLPGFGTVAATGKSMSVWNYFPASMCVYLFHPTDYGDDEEAAHASKAGPLRHGLMPVRDWFRSHTYVANVEYAYECWKQFGGQLNIAIDDYASHKDLWLANPTRIVPIVPETMLSDPSKGRLSKTALLKYMDYLKEQNVPLVVIVMDDVPISRDFFSFCKENGVEVYLIKPEGALRLKKEGHLNQLGNYRLAEFVKKLAASKGLE